MIFISKKDRDQSAGETVRPLLKKVSYVSLVLWVAGVIGIFVFQGVRGPIIPEWILACTGVYFFAQLSILETKPPEEVTRRSTKLREASQPFMTSLNSVVSRTTSVNQDQEDGSGESNVKRLELREDYYAMTWCGFQHWY